MEYLPNFSGIRIALIQRNRITSGLSDFLILSASKGMAGSMIQTQMAFEQGRQIFIPKHTIGAMPNEGFRQAKIDFRAIEVETAEEVLHYINKRDSEKETQTILVQ